MNEINGNILLIDDYPKNLALLRASFDSISNITILTAASGSEGISILRNYDVAVILMDVSMPDMDGFSTVQLIRNDSDISHVPIIFLTAYGDVDLMKGYALGAVDYITKPFNIEILISKVQVFVDLFRLKESVRIQQINELEFEKERAIAAETAMLNEELSITNQRLRDLSNRYVELQEDERKRLARQVHDEFGQQLVATKMKLTIPNNDCSLDDIVGMLDGLIDTTRQLSTSLRPAQLDHLGLIAAINDHAQNFTDQYNIHCDFFTDIDDSILNSVVASTLFRIYQEGLHNILKHSNANYVKINLIKDDAYVELKIKDDGVGFMRSDVNKDGCFGLMGIQERLYPLNGSFEIRSDQGSEMIVKVPT